MLNAGTPALVLAPMDGITDAPMRALQGASGAFSYAVSEFIRVSQDPIPSRVFQRDVPELVVGGVTSSGMPVQVQILGGDPERMAKSALNACRAGATGIDINFGCPAPTVNRHDGGASLLKCPVRIREIVSAVRGAVPSGIPVSAKLRLGWDSVDSVYENAAMAAEGGANWLTIHARTRVQGYAPPVYWAPIGGVQRQLGLPVIANGDIWTLEDFRRCRDETGCAHFMVGRGALADPSLPHSIARELGLIRSTVPDTDWCTILRSLVSYWQLFNPGPGSHCIRRLKQWLQIAAKYGEFAGFDLVKRAETEVEFFYFLNEALGRVDLAA